MGTESMIDTAVTLCSMPHKRIPERGEPYLLPDGREGVGDGVTAIWDLARDGGRPVRGSHDGSLLCLGHANRFADLLASTPKVVEWIRDQIEPTSSQADRTGGYTKATKKEPPLPLSVAAIDAADEELEILTEWVRQVADDRHEKVPVVAGLRVVWRSALRTNRDEWVPDWNALLPGTKVVGFRTHDAATVNTAMNELTSYLIGRMDWIVQQEWVCLMLDEVGRFRRQHLARWPLGDTARRVKGHRCTACHRMSIVVHPPAHAPQWIEDYVLRMAEPHPPVGGIGPRMEKAEALTPLLDALGHRVYDEAGLPVYKVTRRLGYSHPMLVACSDLRCGERVDETYWEWARQIAESGRDIRDREARRHGTGKASGGSVFEGSGWV